MGPDYEHVGGYERYVRRANKLYEQGDRARAEAFGALASALQLFPPGRRKEAPRGEFFGPMAAGSFGEIPDMAFVRKPETIACLRSRMGRIRHLFRRARIADTVWEFSQPPDAEAARIAFDAYLLAGQQQMRAGEEFAPMMGAGAIARATTLARSINDAQRIKQVFEAIRAGIEYVKDREDHVALFTLVEALLRLGKDLDVSLAEEALGAHLERLGARDEDNFHFREGIIEQLMALARYRHDAERLRQLQRDFGENLAAQAAWKGSHYEKGGLVAMHFYAQAADYFEKLGNRKRADELHQLERESYGDIEFSRFEGKIDLELKPFRDWLAKALSTEQGAEIMWPRMLRGLPLPSLDAITQQRLALEKQAPLLSLINSTTVDESGVIEEIPAEEASRRRVEMLAYQNHGANVVTLMNLAWDEHKVGATSAAPALRATGLFDTTSGALLTHVLAAIEARDYVSAAYLAGPLAERLVRAIAKRSQLETMYTERGGGRPRRMQVSIEILLRQIPLHEDLRAYVRWVLTHPGLNLRNEVGHGLLESAECNEVLAAHIVYVTLVLAFADLAFGSSNDEPGRGDEASEE